MLAPTAVDASKLIAIEGIDGAGKTTLCEQLSGRLRARGFTTVSLQRFMIAELTALWHRLLDGDGVDQGAAAMLAAADYHIGAERIIRPALAAGHIVVMDRYVYSHIVQYALRGVPRSHLEMLFGRWQQPDLVLHLKLPADAALGRKRSPRKPDFWEAGLDAGVRGSIGAAYREYLAHPPDRDEVERRFVAHQTRAAATFDAVLPPPVTVSIDATRPGGVVTAQAWSAIEAILVPQHVPADRP